MMTNKWVQAVLCGGFGFGLIIGPAASALSSAPVAVMIIGWLFMVVSLRITANTRGTDGWGGPYRGPKS